MNTGLHRQPLLFRCVALLRRITAATVPLIIMQHAAKADMLQDKADLFLRQTAATRQAAGWCSVILRIDGELTQQRCEKLHRMGAYVYRHLPIIHSVAVQAPSRHLAQLAALNFVKRLSSDATVQKCDEFTVGSSGADVANSQYHLTGSGISIAVLDSGVNTCPDLSSGKAPRIVGNINFQGTKSVAYSDLCGHGTHVAGIIAGNGAGSAGSTYYHTFYGIARAANIVNVRVLDTYGQGTVSSMISGIQWCINKKKTYNIRVMNLSLGHPAGESYATDPLCQTVEQAWKAGIVVVCAAGNNGRLNTARTDGTDNEGWGTAYGSVQSPANDPFVITVGAMKSTNGARAYDNVATYSSRGPTRLDLILKPDIVAPGNCVISLNALKTFLPNTYGATNLVAWNAFCTVYNAADSSKYFRLSGTSMAAPVVSGAAALMLQNDSSLTPDTIKARLMISADKWNFPDGTTDPCTFGAGYINIPASLDSKIIASQYALSPTLTADSSGNVAIDPGSIWGTKAIWGTGISDLKAIWGTNAIVNTNALTSSMAIWGSQVFMDMAVSTITDGSVDLSCKVIYGE